MAKSTAALQAEILPLVGIVCPGMEPLAHALNGTFTSTRRFFGLSGRDFMWRSELPHPAWHQQREGHLSGDYCCLEPGATDYQPF